MSNKTAFMVLLVVVILFVLSGGLASYVDISVDSGNADGIPDNGVSWGEGDGITSHDYTCTGRRENMVCTEK